MSETMEQLASALGCEVSPEPLPVQISHERCSKHGYRMVSMPRDERGDDLGYFAKCPLVFCTCGLLKPRADD